MKLKVPSLQVTTNTTRSSNDGDELSGKLFADESLKNGENLKNIKFIVIFLFKYIYPRF